MMWEVIFFLVGSILGYVFALVVLHFADLRITLAFATVRKDMIMAQNAVSQLIDKVESKFLGEQKK